MKYAFDTNTVIHLMRGTESVHNARDIAVGDGKEFFIPPFVNYEILRGLAIKPMPSHVEAYDIICDNCEIGEMTVAVWQCAAKIYAQLYEKRFTVRDSDILIAAFCIVHGHTLVTNNIKDFENIDGLTFEDWVEV